MAYAGSTVHIACAFSMVEILAVLYRSHMQLVGPDAASDPGRDYLVLSKGHGVMAQYASMHELGWLTDDGPASATSATARCSRGCPTRTFRAWRSPPARWATGCPSASGWRWRPGATGRASAASPSSATARSTRARSGRRCCSPLTSSCPTCWSSSTPTASRRWARPTRSWTWVRWPTSSARSGWRPAKSTATTKPRSTRRSAELTGGSPDRGRAAWCAHTVKGKGVSFMEHDNRWHYTRLDAETYQARANWP